MPFAVDADGTLREVEEVAQGLECKCHCPECDGAVVAKKGGLRAHHFAHLSRKGCIHALEASLFQATIEALTSPGYRLRLPPLASRREMVSFHHGYLDAQTAEKFFAANWVIEPETIALEEPVAIVRKINDSDCSKPDLIVPNRGLEIHLISFRKAADEIKTAIPPSSKLVLGIDLRSYARLWWETCEQDRKGRAERASASLRRWLAETESGRGWLVHSDFEERMAKLRAWLEERRPALPPAAIVQKPKRPPQPPKAAVAQQPPPPLADRPDTVLETAVDFCVICGAPRDKVEFGSGFFAGKRAIVCSSNVRHPMRMLQ